MQLSLHADYACRVLIYLATTNEKSSIDEIAKSFAISQNHLVKVVHKLGQKGYIKTSRGRGGGICLANTPDSISIGKVIKDFESSFNIVECFDSEQNSCPIIKSCGLKPWLKTATNAFLDTLVKVSLADVVKKNDRISRSLHR